MVKSTITIEGKIFDEFPKFTQNDLGKKTTFTITNFDDSVVDLTGGSVKFKTRIVGGTTIKIDGTCTLDTPTSGICSYTTVAGDLDTIGAFEAELEFIDASANVCTVKLGKLFIIAELG